MNPAFTRTESRIGWIATVLIALVTVLGAIAAWRESDALLKLNAALACAFFFWMLRVMTREHLAAWRGTMLFAGFWLAFPLFRAIRQFWITRVFDAELLGIDRALWGGLSLPEHALRLESFALSEIVSFGYAQFYFLVLLPVCWFARMRRTSESRRFFLGLTIMYVFGFVGYLLVPAGGPFIAFPSIFPYPPQGGAITQTLVDVVAQGATGMDVFPSLHCGLSLYVFGFFAGGAALPGKRAYLAAALILATICAPLILATVYLRYHYGIDLLVGAALAAATLLFLHQSRFGSRFHEQ
ncbi:MAG: phosphatase PAP2 family protein [Zoogloeaceae bacterium]|jgi:membrane-associated phospholipid phosphatase|nr:phosphatase PAP2 family protein [Zoogloeaceae bacterium]